MSKIGGQTGLSPEQDNPMEIGSKDLGPQMSQAKENLEGRERIGLF